MAAPKWLSIWPSADPATNIAALLSAIALLSSFKSCAVSQDALTETRTQFRQERQLVLKGEFKDPEGAGCSTIKAVPIAEGFQFQRGEAHLPLFDADLPAWPQG